MQKRRAKRVYIRRLEARATETMPLVPRTHMALEIACCALTNRVRSLSTHLAQRLTRLSGLVPSGTLVAILVNIPLDRRRNISGAAQVPRIAPQEPCDVIVVMAPVSSHNSHGVASGKSKLDRVALCKDVRGRSTADPPNDMETL
jgi:hypothetical protein